MPKREIFGMAVILVILSLLCMYIYDNFRVEKETTLIVEKGNNNNTIVNYVDTKKADYYLYNIDNIIVDFSDRKLDLNKALELKQFTIEEVKEYLEEKVNMNDGKVKLYQNDNFSLLECIRENKTNYIFGDKSMVYKESFCDEKPYLCSFTKTYTVLGINDESKNDDFVYLTIKNGTTGEVATIEVEKDIVKDLEINNNYKFTFSSTNDKIEDDIKTMFDNNRIKEISLLEQNAPIVNENICK